MSSKTGSTTRQAEAVRTAAVVTHGKPSTIGEALPRLERVAAEAGVELLFSEDEAEKHGLDGGGPDLPAADVTVVLGGDGTMLRALQRALGTGTPVVGVNFGEVGFLTSIRLPTLEAEVGGGKHVAVNDVVAAASIVGRMIELGWAVGGEDLGSLPCDGVLCATPSGSTGYNLSNGGPVLVWGLDALVVTFIAPHSLHARPLVVRRGRAGARPARRAAKPARTPARGNVLPALPAHLCFVGSASRTSCSSAKRSSSRHRA